MTKINIKVATKKLQSLRDELEIVFFERQPEITGSLCALLSREHLLFLGAPGTAKSALVRALTGAVEGANHFDILLTKFSTPEEVFGPISFAGMKQDRYERITTGMLPEAHIGFLDEIWKANSAILNALLTIANERKFFNAGQTVSTPLISLFGASNELPDTSDLGALYDRFLLRFQVGYMQSDTNFRDFLAGKASRSTSIDDIKTKISLKELEAMQAEVCKVQFDHSSVESFINIRHAMNSAKIAVSDRRYGQAIKVVKAHAFLGGRDYTNEDDLMILVDCLWSEYAQRAIVREQVGQFSNPLTAQALALQDSAEEAVMAAFMMDKSNKANYVMALSKARASVSTMRSQLSIAIKKANSHGITRASKINEELKSLDEKLSIETNNILA